MPFVNDHAPGGLLADDDPPPVMIVNRFGASPFLLVGDHAGNAIPPALGTLGVSAEDRLRHIAWDIGTRVLGERLAERLDATFVHQAYSRLVIDCNRDPDTADAMPRVSDGTMVPGNEALDASARAVRIRAIHEPYQRAIAETIAARAQTILISLHSFTPRLSGGTERPWQFGVLHEGHADEFAKRLLERLRQAPDVAIGDNAPYRMDRTDHTVPRHAFERGLAYAEIEVRQDLLGDEPGIDRCAAILGAALADAAA